MSLILWYYIIYFTTDKLLREQISFTIDALRNRPNSPFVSLWSKVGLLWIHINHPKSTVTPMVFGESLRIVKIFQSALHVCISQLAAELWGLSPQNPEIDHISLRLVVNILRFRLFFSFFFFWMSTLIVLSFTNIDLDL